MASDAVDDQETMISIRVIGDRTFTAVLGGKQTAGNPDPPATSARSCR